MEGLFSELTLKASDLDADVQARFRAEAHVYIAEIGPIEEQEDYKEGR